MFVAVIKLQVVILARSSQTVRIDCQYILSRVRVSVRPSIFLNEKHPQTIAKIESRATVY